MTASLSGVKHMIITIILVAVGVVLFALLVRTNSTWLFNRWMLWGAGLSFIIGSLVVSLVNTANHHGPGIRHYGGDQPGTDGAISSPEFDAEVSESQYKRETFGENGLMLGITVLVWCVVAQKARNETARAKAKEDYLEAQIKAATTYHRVFASAIDETSRKRAATEAQLSAEFQDAEKAKELMWNAYYAAAKDAKGDYD
jgi:hypothetical protein